MADESDSGTRRQAQARARRDRAARRFQPERVELLLVAEAPPKSFDRYFYFPSVTTHDSLFRYVVRGVLQTEPTRGEKAELLGRLQSRGVFLIDLIREPIGASRHTDHVANLIRRVERLAPEKIILIKAPVYDALFSALREARQPVVDIRVPFPGSGQQKKFEAAFAAALLAKPPASSQLGRSQSQRGNESPIDLSPLGVQRIMRLYREILTELRERGVIRTNNPPTGEYAEHLVRKLTRGTLAKNPSQKGWDVASATGETLQVKSRVVVNPSLRGERQLSPFRSWGFDAAVIVLFDQSFGIFRATWIDKASLQAAARRTEYVSADRVLAVDALLEGGIDVTSRLRAVAKRA